MTPQPQPLIRMICSGETMFDVALDGSPMRANRRGCFQIRSPDPSVSFDGLPMTETPDESNYQLARASLLEGVVVDVEALGKAIDPARKKAIDDSMDEWHKRKHRS